MQQVISSLRLASETNQTQDAQGQRGPHVPAYV